MFPQHTLWLIYSLCKPNIKLRYLGVLLTCLFLEKILIISKLIVSVELHIYNKYACTSWNYCTLKHNVTSPGNMKWGRSPQGVSNTTQTLDLLTNGWFCHQFKLKNIHKVFTKYVPKHQSFPFSQYKHTEIITIFHKYAR